MTEEEYNNLDGLRASNIKAYISNPDKHAYELENPATEIPAHFKLGTAIHMAYYEPERYKTAYHIYEGKTIASGAPNAAGVKELKAEGITEYLTTVETAMIADIVKGLPKLDEKATVEQTFTKVVDGVLLKCRVDAIINGKGQDLKTTQDASPMKFKWAIRDFQYLYQFAFYSIVTGVTEWEILAVEKKPPYINHTYTITAEDLEPYINGSDTVRGLLGTYGLIKEYDTWLINGKPKQGYGENTKISELW